MYITFLVGDSSSNFVPTNPPTTTTTTTTTTQAPVPVGCTDVGWDCGYSHWSCQKLSDYFMDQYTYEPTTWCRDPNWKDRCCQFCAGKYCIACGMSPSC